jgi:outer membrane receptor for ferrienterochelin and colicin
MKIRKNLYCLLILFVGIANIAAGQTTIQLVVLDSVDHQAVFGASIRVDNTTNGVITDVDGKANLTIQNGIDSILTVEAMQYGTKKVFLRAGQLAYRIDLVSVSKELEVVEVSSTRSNSRIDDIPTRIELIGSDDLEEENGIKPGNISSILGDIAGVQLQQVSSVTGNTYARIQGLNGRYTQILRDGIPLFGGFSGNLGLLQIPPLDLKQVELIKGSSSTLYGGDAIGGIINLITKQPAEKKELKFTINQSTLNESNVNGYYAKMWKKSGITLFAGETYQKFGDVNKDGLTDFPQLSSAMIHPKFFYNFSSKSKLDLGYSLILDDRKGGDVDYFSLSNDSLFHLINHSIRHLIDLHYKYSVSDAQDVTLKMSGSYLKNKLFTNEFSFSAEDRIFYSELSYRVRRKKLESLVGVNFNTSQFTPGAESFLISELSNQVVGGFVQATYKANPKLTVEAGLRGDHNSAYGSFLLPHLSVLYKLNSLFTARVNGGYGYKNPDPLSFINIENDVRNYIPNPNLVAEFSKGFNADLNFKKVIANKITLNLNQAVYFTGIQSPIDDLSEFANEVYLTNQNKPINTLSVQTYSRVSFENAELYLSYVYTDAVKKYDQEHPLLIITPRHNLASTFVYELSEQWAAGVEATYYSGQLNQDHEYVKNYLFMAAMIRYHIGIITLVLNCENLLDFRQSNYEKLFDGTRTHPKFRTLWSPIDGRVINLSLKFDVFK